SGTTNMSATSSTTRSWSWRQTPRLRTNPVAKTSQDASIQASSPRMCRSTSRNSQLLPAFTQAEERGGRRQRAVRASTRGAKRVRLSGDRSYAATRDPRLFFIHLQWFDEAAFNAHAQL